VTAPDLDAVQARADAATAGPWTVDDDRQTAYPVVRANGRAVAGCPTSGLGKWPRLSNAVFVAHARTDVPALVAELRAARGARGQLNDLYEDLEAHDAEVLTGATAFEVLTHLSRILHAWDTATEGAP